MCSLVRRRPPKHTQLSYPGGGPQERSARSPAARICLYPLYDYYVMVEKVPGGGKGGGGGGGGKAS